MPRTGVGRLVTYVYREHKRDRSYPTTADCYWQEAFELPTAIQESWIFEGEDREAGFIFALRNLYRTLEFPEAEMLSISFDTPTNKREDAKILGEMKMISKQLIGLPAYGARIHVRNPDTFQVITKRAAEQPNRRRILTRQHIFGKNRSVFEASGPYELCICVQDAIYGLLNAFRMGFVHREITPQTVCIISEKRLYKPGFMLSKDGKSLEGSPPRARHYGGCIWDFPVCKKIDDDEEYVGDSENIERSPCAPTSIIGIQKHSDVLHSPIYDLDSFLWLLLYAATGIIGDYAAGRRKVKLDDPEFLKFLSEVKKKEIGVMNRQLSSPELGSCQEDVADKTSEGEGERRKDTDGDAVTGETAVQNESLDMRTSHEKMDVDENEVTVEREQVNAEDVDMDDVLISRTEKEEGDEHHGDEGNDSEEYARAKKMRRVVVEDDADNESSSYDGDSTEQDDDEYAKSIWYFHELGPGCCINIMKPPDYAPPNDFKPPPKPEFVAFADDKMAHIINTLLQRRELFTFTDRPFRGHLMKKLLEFLAQSPGLAPLVPLITELEALGVIYFTPRADLKTRTFSREEVEEAFERYLDAFSRHMPDEKNWYYLKWYEGTDMICKFDQEKGEKERKFLGAFASPTNYRPS